MASYAMINRSAEAAQPISTTVGTHPRAVRGLRELCRLTGAQWPATLDDGWCMTAISAAASAAACFSPAPKNSAFRQIGQVKIMKAGA